VAAKQWLKAKKPQAKRKLAGRLFDIGALQRCTVQPAALFLGSMHVYVHEKTNHE
jgi:hypothetical protein